MSITEISPSFEILPPNKVQTEVPANPPALVLVKDSAALTELDYAKTLAVMAGIAFVELIDYPIDRTAISLVSAAICRRHEVLPLRINNGRLVLAMADPGNVIAIDDVRAAARIQVEAVGVTRSDLLGAIDRYLRADDELNDLTSAIVESNAPADTNDFGIMESPEGDAPIVRFVNLLVSQAIQDHASDIHIEPAEHDVRVRYRIDGVLHAECTQEYSEWCHFAFENYERY
jgi:type IV pilus assembly protein PilB